MRVLTFIISLSFILLPIPSYAEAPSILGIQVGEPLLMPKCPDIIDPFNYNYPKYSCIINILGDSRTIHLDHPPSYVHGLEVRIDIKGDIKSMRIQTEGAVEEMIVLQALTEKLGLPTENETQLLENRFGVKTADIEAIWNNKDSRVVLHGVNLGNPDEGVIVVFTREAADKLDAVMKSQSAVKTPL